MKSRIFVPLLAALLLPLGTALAACGDDGGGALTVEEYFQKLEAISSNASEQADAIEEEAGGIFDPEASEEQAIANAKTLFGGSAKIFREAANDTKDLDPPSEVRDAHDDFVDALESLVDAVEDLADRVEGAESVANLEEIFTEFSGPELEETGRNFDSACLALEGVASDNGIQVDLGCQ